MVLLRLAAAGSSRHRRKTRQFLPAQASCRDFLALGSSYAPTVAAQTRIVSAAGIRLDHRKSVRPFKGIFATTFVSSSSGLPRLNLSAKHVNTAQNHADGRFTDLARSVRAELGGETATLARTMGATNSPTCGSFCRSNGHQNRSLKQALAVQSSSA